MMKSAVIITILLLSSFVASAEKVYTVDCNGGGDFRTIQACFDALPSKPAEWRTVRIMPGVYREKVTLDVYKDKVRILGDEMAEPRIVWGDYAGKVVDGRELTTYDSYTMSVQADDVYLDCLTVENDAGRVGQAVALETRGDRIVDPAFQSLRFLLRNHRPDEGVAQLGIAGFQCLDLHGQHVAEAVVDAAVLGVLDQ